MSNSTKRSDEPAFPIHGHTGLTIREWVFAQIAMKRMENCKGDSMEIALAEADLRAGALCDWLDTAFEDEE